MLFKEQIEECRILAGEYLEDADEDKLPAGKEYS
jgi:hypothetical protein